MIRIKRFIHLFIIMMITMIAVNFSGCGEKAVPVSSAALDLQSRFEEAFDDNSENHLSASGTVRFNPITEPMSETSIIINTTTDTADNITTTIFETIQTIQEEKFVVTPSGTRYHVKSCHTANNIKEYLTREEAESKGYDPCKICKP